MPARRWGPRRLSAFERSIPLDALLEEIIAQAAATGRAPQEAVEVVTARLAELSAVQRHDFFTALAAVLAAQEHPPRRTPPGKERA